MDGSCKKGFKKWKKTTVHPTYLNKKMTARELLVSMLYCSSTLAVSKRSHRRFFFLGINSGFCPPFQIISLRKCGISDDPGEYYLADVSDSDNNEERELAPDEPPYNIPPRSHGVLRLYIRSVITISC